jgi:hypothetical protein
MFGVANDMGNLSDANVCILRINATIPPTDVVFYARSNAVRPNYSNEDWQTDGVAVRCILK